MRRGSGSVATWRRAQMVLLSAQVMDAPAIAKVAFTSENRGRDVIRNFNEDGVSSLYPEVKRRRRMAASIPSGHIVRLSVRAPASMASSRIAPVRSAPRGSAWLRHALVRFARRRFAPCR